MGGTASSVEPPSLPDNSGRLGDATLPTHGKNGTGSLHRSQISENLDLKDYVMHSGSSGRIRPRDSGDDFCRFFGKRIFKQSVSIPLV
jgi:hypothetical protein